MNFRQFRDGLVWVSILVRKRLDLHHVLDVISAAKRLGTSTKENNLEIYI